MIRCKEDKNAKRMAQARLWECGFIKTKKPTKADSQLRAN